MPGLLAQLAKVDATRARQKNTFPVQRQPEIRHPREAVRGPEMHNEESLLRAMLEADAAGAEGPASLDQLADVRPESFKIAEMPSSPADLSSILKGTAGASRAAGDFIKRKQQLTTQPGLADQAALYRHQKRMSPGTDIGQVPATFKRLFETISEKLDDGWPGRVFDLGGGRGNQSIEALKKKGIALTASDPQRLNNEEILKNAIANPFRVTTINNVVNVIEEPMARKQLYETARHATEPGGQIVIKVHQGDGLADTFAKNAGRVTKESVEGIEKESWQNHQKTKAYVDEIEKYFGKGSIDYTKLSDGIIIVRNPHPKNNRPMFRK